MELFGGLAFVGNALNKKDIRSSNRTIKNKIKNGHPSGMNIYNSENYHLNRQFVSSLAKDRFDKSEKADKTGVIPNFYNRSKLYKKKISTSTQGVEHFDSDSEFSDDGYASSNSCVSNGIDFDDPAYLMNKSDKITDNIRYEQEYLKKTKAERNTFLNQFDDMRFDNPSVPSSFNAVGQASTENGLVQRAEASRKMALDGGYSFINNDGMDYGIVDKANFTHNNMRPWFKSKGTYGTNPLWDQQFNNLSQRTMELFTGSTNNLDYRPKSERKPLFDPVAGFTNIYGMPTVTPMFESRYVPSIERRNEKLMQEIKVTPGLNLGYNEVGKQGFHDAFRYLPKTVDELRTLNNPKISYGSVVVPGMKGQKGPVPTRVFKRRPLTFREYGPEWLIKGVGDYRAQTLYGQYDPTNMATVNRGIFAKSDNHGPAQYYNNQLVPESMKEKVRTNVTQQFKHADPRNIQRLEAKEARDHDNSYDPKMTQRMQRNEYIGHAGNGEHHKNQVYTLDTPDATKRNMHEHFDRAGASIGNNQFNKHQLYTLDTPDATKRNVHEKTDRSGNLGNAQFDKARAYTIEAPDATKRDIHDKTDRVGQIGNSQFNKHQLYTLDTPEATKRNIHEKTDRAGNIGNGQFDKARAYTVEAPDATKRNIHEKTDRAGNMGNGQFDKARVYTVEAPDATKRNIHEKTDRAGAGVGNGTFDKSRAYTVEAPDATKRNIHEKTDRAGHAGNGEFHKARAYTVEAPDATKRNIHEKTDRAGGALGNRQFEKPYVYDPVNWTPDVTHRDTYNSSRSGGGIGNRQFEKQQGRADSRNMIQNITKEVVAKGRAPTLSNYSKGPVMDYTTVQLCDKIQINRELYPDIKQTTTDKLGFEGTKSPTYIPNDLWRWWEFPVENLDGNPYINNVVHKAV